MRQWRVGTISMGVSLILAGVVFLVSVWQGISSFDTLIAWWPVIFILLGGEILVYIFMSTKKENPVIKYDLLSIFIVGALLLSCFSFALATSSGFMHEVRYALGAVEVTEDLPHVEQSLPEEVKQVVINTSYRMPVKVELTQERSLQLFGQYSIAHHPDHPSDPLSPKDYMSIQMVGDTAYISLKDLPHKRGPFATYSWASVIVTLPEDVQVEIRDRNHRVMQIES